MKCSLLLELLELTAEKKVILILRCELQQILFTEYQYPQVEGKLCMGNPTDRNSPENLSQFRKHFDKCTSEISSCYENNIESYVGMKSPR